MDYPCADKCPYCQKEEESRKTSWFKAQKRPVVIEFREVKGIKEIVETLEGTLTARRGRDWIIRGVNGEEYLINKKIFNAACDVLPDWLQKMKTHEAFWKSDLIGRLWAYARSEKLVSISPKDYGYAGYERLPEGISALIAHIRSLCDRCGKTPEQAYIDSGGLFGNETYQCCWVQTIVEDHAPKLCIDCHQALQRLWPHSTISV